MKKKVVHVIFVLSESQKHLIEVARRVYPKAAETFCKAHAPHSTIFIYRAEPERAEWYGWGKDSQTWIPLSGDLLLRQVIILNSFSAPFGDPDDWRERSDGPAPSTEEDYDPYYTLEHE